VVWLLSLAAGATDALCLLRLGGVFASVITGNLVVLGASAARNVAGPAVRAVVAVGAYALGVFVGSRLITPRGHPAQSSGTPHPAPGRCLVLETILLVGLGAGWLASRHRPGGGSQLALLALAGAGMGLQSVAAGSLGRPGLSTTYLTGAATRLVSGIGEPGWRRRFDWVQVRALPGVIVGAAAEAVVLRYVPWIGPLPAILLAAAAALVVRVDR
jgi:uncharacterized membrane protein YoaK (UPF0700 family)